MKSYKSKFSEDFRTEEVDVLEKVKSFIESSEQVGMFVCPNRDEAKKVVLEIGYPFVSSSDSVLAFGKIITGRKTHYVVELNPKSDLHKFSKLMEVADEKEIEKVVVLIV